MAVKSFMNADRMEAKWRGVDGKSVLILAQAEVDKTGASYYGKTQVKNTTCNILFDWEKLPLSLALFYMYPIMLYERMCSYCDILEQLDTTQNYMREPNWSQ